jgi:large subunit ribosomal protein L29
MSAASELREMSDEQIVFAMNEAKQELFRLRFQASTEKLDAPSNLRRLRRDIARMKTIQRERELQAAGQEASAAT